MYDAIVVAGGAARRLDGADKPGLLVGDSSLLERVVAAVGGAEALVVVGPPRPLARDVVWCREDPPGGGPVAAIAAGFAHTSSDAVVVLAADLPAIAPAVPVLLATLDDGAAAALLVDSGGRVNNLAGAWRREALAAALEALGDPHGAAVRALVAAVGPVLVADPSGWGQDCDTWDDLDRARDREGHG
ncbi:MAG TPA: NTP transferase domain-containing protein [Jatrophihabitans sp.]|uniref:molybdenum cofactor guanylyltransferase n=1 Tax=Jatrophihabitans sp. TaxID=1932789 RepID=UPI002DF79CEE|nr:NTP transferase domain-containing protein [Jatrophihabitans sp.]